MPQRQARMTMVVAAIAVLIATAGIAAATPIVITDPYAGPTATGGGACCTQAIDVIGTYSDFDVQSITFGQFSTSGVALAIRFNYFSGDATLQDHFDVTSVGVGDLLFDVNGVFKYGVALANHDGFIAGNLYSITGTRTSDYYLNAFRNQLYWRFNTPARMDPTGSTLLGAGVLETLHVLADGTVGTPTPGNPATNEVQTTIAFTPSASFVHDAQVTGMLSVHFASVICANDVIDGITAQLPEEGTMLWIGLGLAGIATCVVGVRRGERTAPALRRV